LSDKIILKGVALACHIGITAQERFNAQPIRVYLELHMPLDKPAASDDFADAVDYVQVRNALHSVSTRREYILVESLAGEMANEILAKFPVQQVLLRVSKPMALAAMGVEDTVIEMTRRRA
jgi:dihydroneopterin aldolase